jgi:hypothetical protein
MSCFELSKGSCSKLVSLMARFWWSGNLDKRSLHWTAWDKLAVPKEKGGMGFRDMHTLNIALHRLETYHMSSFFVCTSA